MTANGVTRPLDLATSGRLLPAPPAAGRYHVIYADPPWRFDTYSDKGKGRSAEAHYDCLSLNDIKALPVADWAAGDAVLLLWVTDPLLPRGLDVMAAWGFTYKTIAFVWAKLNRRADPDHLRPGDFFRGLGYWTRANPELCLLGTRGQPKRVARDVDRLVIAPRREHSRKPEEIYQRIERLVDGPYLELFARQQRERWHAWGAQAGLFDHGPVETRRRPSVG
ncbi:MAG: MT-A70 family methyltransferase [Geminicoccaceae bacterium]